MKNRAKRRIVSAFAIAALLIAGCESENPPQGQVQPNAQVQDPIVKASLPERKAEQLTPVEIGGILRAGLTQEETKKRLGTYYATSEFYEHVQGKLELMDVWRYDFGEEATSSYGYDNSKWGGGFSPDLDSLRDERLSAQLFMEWTKDGKFVYAILYYKGQDGKVHNYIPAYGGLPSASSEDSRLAREHGIEIGQTVRLARNGNAYSFKFGPLPDVAFMTSREETYKVKAITPQFAELDREGELGWVPLWELTEGAAKMKRIAPKRMAVKDAVAAGWYPDAGISALSLAAGDIVYAYEEAGNDYGVVVDGHPFASRSPELVWVDKSHLEPAKDPYKPIFAEGTEIDQGLLSTAVNSVLRLGTTQERVRSVLGSPHFMETSGNVKMTGEPMQTLEVWRYEHPAGQVTVTWSEDRTLREYDLRLAGAGDAEPFIPSKEGNFAWRVSGSLPFNFLVGKAKDTLLVFGDDGGFSGFHYASNLYGVDRKTGKKRWQADFGYDLYNYVISEDEERMAYFVGDQKNDKPNQSAFKVEVRNPSTGRVLWSKKLVYGNEKEQVWNISFSAAGNAIGVIAVLGDETTKRSVFEARDFRTGKLLWNSEWAGESRLRRNHSATPYFLVQRGDHLVTGDVEAVDSQTGKEVWRIQDRKMAEGSGSFFLQVDERNLNGNQATIWTVSAERLILVDVKTGKDLIAFPFTPVNDRYFYSQINDRFLFQMASRDQERIWDSQDVMTSFIDLETGKTYWTAHGKVEGGVVEGDRLYYALNGKLRAVEVQSGKLIWESGLSGSRVVPYRDDLIVQSSPDTVVIRKSDGAVRYRISDQMTGGLEIKDNYWEYGSVSVVGDELFLGSMNGYFSKADLK